jgi:putative flippase GtrA
MRWPDAAALRFLLGGAANTALGYVLYLLLNLFLDYRWAYSISFAAGIVLSFVINSVFVFRQPLRWRRLVVYPVVYAIQYCVGLAAIWLFVAVLRQPEHWAPLAAIALSLPITYIATRFVLGAKTDAASNHR